MKEKSESLPGIQLSKSPTISLMQHPVDWAGTRTFAALLTKVRTAGILRESLRHISQVYARAFQAVDEHVPVLGASEGIRCRDRLQIER